MAKIAFLGLGSMGKRMAANLAKAGHELVVWNRTPGRADELTALGASQASSPAAAAQNAAFVFAMVLDDKASGQVWLDPAEGALAAMDRGAVGIDCSTVSVPQAKKLAAAFEKSGIAFIDAPVSGSLLPAETGELIFLTGGEPDAIARTRPIFDIMGSAVHHAGANGAGAALKLIVNAMYGAQMAAIAELIGFAGKIGIDPSRAVDILGSTHIASPAMKKAAAGMVADSFEPMFPVDLCAKDFRTITGSAGAFDAPVPVANAVLAIFERAVSAGYGALNGNAIVKLYRDGT